MPRSSVSLLLGLIVRLLRVSFVARVTAKSLHNNMFGRLNTMLTVDKHCSDVCCDEFSVPQIDRKSKQVKEQ